LSFNRSVKRFTTAIICICRHC